MDELNRLEKFYAVVHKEYLKARELARDLEEFQIINDPDEYVETTSDFEERIGSDDEIAREFEWLDRFTRQTNYRNIPVEWRSSLKNILDMAENLESIPEIEELPSINSVNVEKQDDYYEMKELSVEESMKKNNHMMNKEQQTAPRRNWRKRLNFLRSLCCVAEQPSSNDDNNNKPDDNDKEEIEINSFHI